MADAKEPKNGAKNEPSLLQMRKMQLVEEHNNMVNELREHESVSKILTEKIQRVAGKIEMLEEIQKQQAGEAS